MVLFSFLFEYGKYSLITFINFGLTIAQVGAYSVTGGLPVQTPTLSILVIVFYDKTLAHLAYWWSESLMVPVFVSISSVSLPQDSCVYYIADHYKCVNVCLNG